MSSSRIVRRSAARRPGARGVVAAVAAGGLAATVAWLGAALALATAEGATRVPGAGETYDTEFIEDWLYVASAVVSVGLVGMSARLWWPPAAVGLVGAEAALWWGGSETVVRYVESGWSDGLEVFVYVVPVLAGVVGLVFVASFAQRGSRPAEEPLARH